MFIPPYPNPILEKPPSTLCVTLRPALCWPSLTGDVFLNSNRFIAVAAVFLASAGIAHATRNPTPPPSGVVVHLFGPHGIMTPILPGDDTKHSTQDQNGTQGATAGATAGTPDSANSLQTSDDPSLHDILHQMFVTGDPNDPNKPAGGRPGERQNVQ